MEPKLIKIEPKLECGSLSQREFQVLIFGETLQVDVLYNLEFADYIQDTRISTAQHREIIYNI